ncbi:MAG: replicative DNA helicase [Terrimicrobiaceae bacterium]
MTTDSPAVSVENPVKTSGLGQGKFREGGRSYSQKSGAYLPDIHRSLPQSLDAEKGLIGSILLAPGRVLDECIQQQVTEKYFHHPAHARIFTVLVDMRETNKPVDLISLTQLLEDRHLLEEVGGAAAVTDLFTFVPTASNAAYYLEILREKYLLRAIIGTCTEYGARAYEEQGDVQILLDEAEQKILAIGDDRFRAKVPEMKELAMEALDSIEKLFQNRGALTGLPTGFKGIDVMTNGMHGGEMIVIAARPSMGKTALAMNIAEHVSIEAGKPVAVYSLEMSTQQLMQRLLCSHARVDLKKIRDGFIGKHDMTNLIQATTRLSECKMFIDDTPGLGILELRARARRLKDRHDVQLIVIDYLQLLRSPSRRGQENRQVEVAEISSGIKALAKELSVPIVVLAQLNRNPEARTGDSKGRPRLSDLRESGSIEQDADLVGLLWREEYYADDDEEKKEIEGKAELVIAKQRNGPVGGVPLTFLKHITRFEDRAPEREEPAR